MSNAITRYLNRTLVGATLRSRARKGLRELQAATRNPEKAQQATLLRIIEKQKLTAFGVDRNFDQVKNVEDYRRLVTVNDYETLRSYIEKQDETGCPFINHDQPAIYTVTSGTTGKPKFIPVLESTLQAQKLITNIFTYSIYLENPETFNGKIFAVVSPGTEGRMPSGIPLGSASGQLYEGMPKRAQSIYVVHPKLNTIEDYDLKYLTMLRLGLQTPDVTFLTTANPSTFARLIDILNKNWDMFARDLENGTFSKIEQLDKEQRTILQGLLKAQPERADTLSKIYALKGALAIKDVWPQIKTVATWTGGNSMIFLGQMKNQFPEGVRLRDLGYLSSEFRGTTPLSSDTTAGVPTMMHNFFEFVETEKWEAGNADFLGLHEIENEKEYYVFITTDAGLYRYNMNDIVRVSGFYNKTPMLRFVQKGAGVTNITGEKLFENQVIHAVNSAEAKFSATSAFYLMIADEVNSRYNLYYEPTEVLGLTNRIDDITSHLDEALGEINIEYATKRKSGRLKAPLVKILQPGTYTHYRRFCVEVGGQRESQFKIIALQPSKKVKFAFDSHVIGAPLSVATLQNSLEASS